MGRAYARRALVFGVLVLVGFALYAIGEWWVPNEVMKGVGVMVEGVSAILMGIYAMAVAIHGLSEDIKREVMEEIRVQETRK